MFSIKENHILIGTPPHQFIIIGDQCDRVHCWLHHCVPVLSPLEFLLSVPWSDHRSAHLHNPLSVVTTSTKMCRCPSVLQPVVVTRCRLVWYHLRDCDGERTVTTSNLITVIFSPGPVLADAAVLLTDPFNYLGLTMLLTIEGGGTLRGVGRVWAGTQYHFLRCNLNLIHVLRSTFAADNG